MLIYYLVFLFWFVFGLDLIWGVLKVIPVLSRKNAPFPTSYPKISILFAARDEERHIHAALTSFLALDYPNFEVIAVNDRSSDRTLELMMAKSDERLKVVDIKSLPAQWVGKNHALQEGYKHAEGEWLIFTDADVSFEDAQTLRSIMGFALKGGWDHIALLPRMVLKGALEKLFTTAFGIGFYFHFRPWGASNPKSKAHIGVGAFNLIRRDVYEKLGTHQSFRMNVLDDMELGRRVKACGFRQTAVFGHELISVPWIEGWQGILRSLEKNGFAGLKFNLWVLIFLSLLSFFLNGLPYVGLWIATGIARLLCFATLFMIFLVYASLQRHHKNTFFVFFLHPIGCFLVLFVLWRSALLALIHNGVRWRDTFYSLQSLQNEG